MIRVRCRAIAGWSAKVEPNLRNALRAFAAWYDHTVDGTQHTINVDVLPTPFVELMQDDAGAWNCALALIEVPHAKSGAVRVRVAGALTDGEDAVLSLAHELVHYEQWRDDREMTERGVEQRARSLVKKWRAEA